MKTLIGAIALIVYAVNTVFWALPIFVLSFFKAIIPLRPWRTLLSRPLDGCAVAWVSVNNLTQRITTNTRWQVHGVDKLPHHEWYLVIANHQSWVDILVLQRIFNGKIPFLKFFLKQQLIWVPVLGLAWWALDFPFMRRYSKAFLAKHPHLKGKDLETTQKACRKFRFKPVSIMNFVEGTRFTAAKHQRQGSRFHHLLTPRAGGIAFVVSAMGEQLNKLLDVTIHYPDGSPSFWDFVSGKVRQITVSVRVLSLDHLKTLDYFENPEQREYFQAWLNELWLEKDQQLQQLSALA